MSFNMIYTKVYQIASNVYFLPKKKSLSSSHTMPSKDFNKIKLQYIEIIFISFKFEKLHRLFLEL